MINPAIAASDLAVAVRTEKGDGTTVDSPDPSPFLFAVVAQTVSIACQADFNGDGRVYFADLFLFGDAFGGTGSTVFDLDGDNSIGFSDFFAFAEVFGARCDSTDIDLVDDDALELEIVVDLLGGTQMEFALIRAGSFIMGSPEGEEGRLFQMPAF